MAQLTYDEIRLLRELKNSNRKISGNKPHEGLTEVATFNNAVPLDEMLNEITLYWLTNSAASSAKILL